MGNCNCKNGASGQGKTCPECDILQMARNNYFTGKLLVERDFTDEQRYNMGKVRRHNQRLHGWGVACGLKVKQHPNPACQTQYVVVKPGTAIDCCGREILVEHEGYFDFESSFLASWQKQKGPNSQPDANAHVIEICVSYRECPSENVPAVFDDCSAGGGSCQPNRIVEGHCFEVMIDPKNSTKDPDAVALKWEFTEFIANVVCTAEDDSNSRLYVLTSTVSASNVPSAALYVIDTTNYSLVASTNFAKQTGLDVVVDSSSQFVYVALQPQKAGSAPQINIYAALGDFSAAARPAVSVGSAPDATLQITPVPGAEGSLVTWGKTAGLVFLSGLNTASPSQVPYSAISNPVSVVLSSITAYGYVASSSSNTITVVQVAKTGIESTTSTIALASGASPVSLALQPAKAGETLAALDTSAKTLYFATIPTAGPSQAKVLTQTVTTFTYAPLQVLLSPDSHWAYVLEQDAGSTPKAYVQAVDVDAVAAGKTSVLGSAVDVGITAASEFLSQDGSHLYISFTDTSKANLGGVAVVDITETDCSDVFNRLVDGCPDCSDGNCIVLATIAGYTYDSTSVTDAIIDNLSNRRLLPSTDLIAEAVQCLIDQGTTSGTGTKGSTGAQGTPGGGLEKGLVAINALSWAHATLNSTQIATPPSLGLDLTAYGANPSSNNNLAAIVIGFSGDVQIPPQANIGDVLQSAYSYLNVFEVYFDPNQGTDLGNLVTTEHISGFYQPQQVIGAVIGVQWTPDSGNPNLIASASVAPSATTANGLGFIFDQTNLNTAIFANQGAPLIVRVRLKGDFVLDTNTPDARAISAQFVRAGASSPTTSFPTGERPQGSGYFLEGGTFESWFGLLPPP